MELQKAMEMLRDDNNKLDILEILWIKFTEDFLLEDYYNSKLKELPKWEYFLSDLDGTFFRWVLQKEAISLFVKYVRKQNILEYNIDEYTEFCKDLKYFDILEKQAYNKEVQFFEYLHAGIYLLIKHRGLVVWSDYKKYLKNSFLLKEKITPYRFSFQKLKEVIDSGKNFLFISWAPNFIFDIYLDILKEYVEKNIWPSAANNIYGFWTKINIDNFTLTPLWWPHHKSKFIDILKEKNILTSAIGWMGDTSSDFWISYKLDPWSDFYFVNPDKRVITWYDDKIQSDINYHLIFERKDLIYEMKKEDITLL